MKRPALFFVLLVLLLGFASPGFASTLTPYSGGWWKITDETVFELDSFINQPPSQQGIYQIKIDGGASTNSTAFLIGGLEDFYYSVITLPALGINKLDLVGTRYLDDSDVPATINTLFSGMFKLTVLNAAGASQPYSYLQGSGNNFSLYVGQTRVGVIHDAAPSTVPVPGAVWLLGSGLVGLVGLRRKYLA